MNSSTTFDRSHSGSILHIRPRKAGNRTIRKVLLACGILSSLWYVAINIITPFYYGGYQWLSQTVSELSAINAPSRHLWVLLCTFYSILVIAFGCGISLAAGGSKNIRVVGMLMVIYGISGFFWPPMHQREVLAVGGGTLTDTIHIVFAAITISLMLLMIVFGSGAFDKRFRYYSYTTLFLLLVFGLLTGIEGPRIAKNLSTPFIGLWERVNIGVYMVWVVVFSVKLLGTEMNRSTKNDTSSIGNRQLKQAEGATSHLW